MVATDRGGTTEFVRDGTNGLLVDPEDTHALAKAMLRVLDEPDLGHRLALAGSQAVLGYSWDRVAERYEALVAGALQ